MPKVIARGLALWLLLASFCTSGITRAQIAPTNTATVSGSVSDSTGKPVASAKIFITGPKNSSTSTDSQGLFVFVGMPFGTYQISAAAVGLGTAMRTLLVTGDTNVAIQYQPLSANGLKVIAQVSSNVSALFNVTPASVTQVNPIANAFEGKTSWRTILEQIPGVAQAGLGNGNNTFASIPDAPFVPVKIAIDGALPYETSVLFDDMPLIGSSTLNSSPAGSGTDLGLYALNSFGSADVVRGPGANAPSIVNSIGGSFVLHAPGVITENRYDFSLSSDPYGGINSNVLAALKWGKLSIILTYGVNDSPGPLSNAGIPAYACAPLTVNGQPFSSSPGSLVALYDPHYSPNSAFYGFETNFLMCCINQTMSWTQHSGSIGLTYALSRSLNVGFFYTGQASQTSYPSAYYDNDFMPPVGYSGSISGGQQFLNANATILAPWSHRASSSLLEEKIVAQIGRGVVRFAALQNHTFATNDYSVPTSLDLQLYGSGCLPSTTTSPGCPTGYSQAVFNGNTYSVTFPSLSTAGWCQSNNRDLLLSYSTPIGENFHMGASFVQSYYDTPSYLLEAIPGNFNLIQNTSPSISQTTNETRFFFGGNPSEKTSLDLSMYFADADYHVPNPNGGGPQCLISFTGSTLNLIETQPSAYIDARYSYAAPRLGFVWRPTASIAVRAAAGGGFAEAPLGDLVGSNGVCIPSATTCGITLVNVHLQPEKSFAFDAGTDIRLHRGTVLSFDIYRASLFGQLYNSTTFIGNGVCPGNTTAPCYATQFGNLGVSRYEGILIDVHRNVPHGLYWSLSGGLTRGYLVSVPAGFYNTAGGTCNPSTGANCQNLTVVPNVNFNGTFTASIPYAQGLGTLGYRWSAEKYANLVATYYGNNNTYFQPAFVEFDGHLGYPLSKNSSLLVTFRNITGVYDEAVQTLSPAIFSGAPTISGLPYALYHEPYGPRTVLLTLHASL